MQRGEESVMSGDYSRNTFDPKKHFSGVLMQQGRVQLDADWNELVGIIERRLRAETTDIIGRCVVSKETPDGFKIALDGSTLTIGPGRIYMHGLLAENHGKAPLAFDSVLAEERGTAPVPYNEQPYLLGTMPVEPPPTTGGPHLVYLDVWQREVTYLENPELIEKAVGVDTTARWQTVWQVRVLPNVGSGVTCATPDEQIPGWLELTRPSAGRLTTAAVGVPNVDDPCLLPPTGGYKGLENQLYRLEIHDKGAPGAATFKWSRDNATVATTVTAIPALDTLTVVRTGRDSFLRFNIGDWVEITDDWREFAGLPGEMRKIKTVDDATQTLVLTTPLQAGTFPTDAQGQPDPVRHTRVRRWDQKKQVKDTNGNLLADLDDPTSTGVIPVPSAGTSIILENGVQVTFGVDLTVGPQGRFQTGDYWVFAARATDASVEELKKAPPLGIHHHYGRLALVTFPGPPTDCRVLWPPDVTGEGCDCSVCVTADSHNNGALTIQRAIDRVRETGGTVCLGPGQYNLGEERVRIRDAQSVRVKGQGWKTLLVHEDSGPAVIIENSFGVTLEELALIAATREDDASPVVTLRNNVGVTLQRAAVLQIGSHIRTGPAISLEGYLFGTVIRENALAAAIGVSSPAEAEGRAPYLFTAGLLIEDNLLWCGSSGVSLGRFSLHFAETRLAGNAIYDCGQVGILATGAVLPGFRLDISHNEFHVGGNGVVVGTDGTRIQGNDLGGFGRGESGDGIVLVPGLDRTGMDHCQILENRIIGVRGHGIVLRAPVRSAMIKQNAIDGVGGGGILMEEQASAEVLSIENNQLLNIAPRTNAGGESVVGIRVLRAEQAEVANNTIQGVGLAAVQNASRLGIQIVASTSVQITGNQLINIGPREDFLNYAAGIELFGSFERATVTDNLVRQGEQQRESPGRVQRHALTIKGADWGLVAGARGGFIAADNRIGFVLLEARLLGIFDGQLHLFSRDQELVAVRGNMFEVQSDTALVFVVAIGDCSFSENHCSRLLRVSSPVVEMRLRAALIASSNHVRGSGDIGMSFQVDPKQVTAVGNITNGIIQINGATLGMPWAPLNVIV
jgi:hypothetical protein